VINERLVGPSALKFELKSVLIFDIELLGFQWRVVDCVSARNLVTFRARTETAALYVGHL
jgi:hypothetical protein